VAKEKKIVEQMLVAAEVDDLIDERKILRAAIDQASKRQAKQLETMVDRIGRRVDDIIEDDDITLMLL